MSESEADTSTSAQIVEHQDITEKSDLLTEPEAKRPKISESIYKQPLKYKLEERLGGILCCAVCLDLPKAAVYQVSLCLKIKFCLLHNWQNKIFFVLVYCNMRFIEQL